MCLIYEKKNEWFTGEENMDLHDIESAFTSLLKLYKSGKYYLIRANVKQNMKIFDERGEQIANERVDATAYMITVLEIQTIKFASKNFQIEVEMKQCMVVSPDPFSESCFIKHATTSSAKSSNASASLSASTSIKENNNVGNKVDTKKGTTEMISSLIDKIAEESDSKSTEALGEIKLNIKEEEDDNFIEDDTTKMNTELNSIMKSEIQRKPDLGNNDDDEDDDDGGGDGGNIQIGDSIDALSLGIIEIEKDNDTMDENNLKEIELNADNSLETISLKKPNEVYYEIYKTARKKAKEIKRDAIAAYLEAKNIKKTYMLDDMEDTDSDFDEMSVNESEGE